MELAGKKLLRKNQKLQEAQRSWGGQSMGKQGFGKLAHLTSTKLSMIQRK